MDLLVGPHYDSLEEYQKQIYPQHWFSTGGSKYQVEYVRDQLSKNNNTMHGTIRIMKWWKKIYITTKPSKKKLPCYFLELLVIYSFSKNSFANQFDAVKKSYGIAIRSERVECYSR